MHKTHFNLSTLTEQNNVTARFIEVIVTLITPHWLLDNSRIRQLADCQLADWTTRGLGVHTAVPTTVIPTIRPN